MRAAVIVLVAFLVAADGPKAGVPGDGNWQVVAYEDAGSKVSEGEQKKWSIELEGEKFVLKFEGKKNSTGTIKFDAAAKPGGVEFRFGDGPWKGEEFVGIYKLEGDRYTLCYVPKGRPVPKEFATKTDERVALITYQREAKP